MAEVVLATPPRPEGLRPEAFEYAELSAPPLGLLSLAAVLELEGIGVTILDAFRDGLDAKTTARRLAASGAAIAGLTCTTRSYPEVTAMSRHLRELAPEVGLVLGGPHATARPRFCIEAGFDAVVEGEAEAVVAALCRELLHDNRSRPRAGLPGVWWQNREPAGGPLPADLETVPVPARHLVDLHRYLQSGAVMTSRGCPGRCYFCSERRWGWRGATAKRVEEELGALEALGVDHLEILDNAFLADSERAVEVARRVGLRRWPWSMQATVEDVLRNERRLEELVDSGLKGVFVGIESGSAEVLQRAKGLRLEEVRRAIRVLASAGVENVVASFMIGHPWDTKKTIKDTRLLINEISQSGVHTPVSIVVPYPGTPLGDSPSNFGVSILSNDYSRYTGTWALLETRFLSAQDIFDEYLTILDEISSGDAGRHPHESHHDDGRGQGHESGSVGTRS